MNSGNNPPFDLKQMLAQVCAEHNVRIDGDDPAVAVVALNGLIVEAALSKAVEQIRVATAELDLALHRVQVRAGAVMAQEMREALRRYTSAIPAQAPKHPQSRLSSMTALAVGAFFLGFLVAILLT